MQSSANADAADPDKDSRNPGAGGVQGEQISQVNDSANSSQGPQVNATNEGQPPKVSKETRASGLDFELHYGLSGGTLGGLLWEILQSISSQHIHNWDDKLTTSPLQALRKVGLRSWRENHCNLSHLQADSLVDEVFPVNEADRSPLTPAAPEKEAAIDSYLFFTKRPASILSPKIANSTVSTGDDFQNRAGTESLNLAQGRVVYVKDEIPYLERVTLLIVYAFCIRLQYEDYSYIRTFIERHLSLRCFLKIPYHWQDTSPPELNSSQQICYKRVTLSCHIVYLILRSDENLGDKEDMLDRKKLFPFHHHTVDDKPDPLYLFKTSSSVLLTLSVPEVSEFHEEEVNLLKVPEALWTLLVVNCSSEVTFDHRTRHHFTPIAQYIRGIASSLYTQKNHAQSIYDALKAELKDCEGESIFDDENFTKSTSYHWAVKTCDELNESLVSSLRFIRRMMISQVDELHIKAHVCEKLGVEYWLQQLKEEIFELEDMQAQILALRSQVLESRNALHGVTSVLDSRTALQQGERMKILAYLATVYLPLTATASLYSMSVFPKTATFPSFFVVFAITFLLTILLGLNLKKMLQRLKPMKTQGSTIAEKPLMSKQLKELFKMLAMLLSPAILYIGWYLRLLNPYNDYEYYPEAELMILRVLEHVILRIPILILRKCIMPEICMPIDQYILFRYRNNRYHNIQYRPIYFVKDIIRGLLIPVWITVAAGIIACLVVRDIIGACLALVGLLFGGLFMSVGFLCAGCGMKNREEQGIYTA